VETSRRKETKSRSRSRDRDVKGRDREERNNHDRNKREKDQPREPRGTKRDSRGRSISPARRASPAVRQRSPPKGPRQRSRERLHDNDRGGGKDRDRERAKNTKDYRTSGSSTAVPPRGPKGNVNGDAKHRDTSMTNGIDEADEENLMQQIMGFGGFRSTKNTKVPGNDKNYGVRKDKRTQYRQYMNRQGGFNRPLDAL